MANGPDVAGLQVVGAACALHGLGLVLRALGLALSPDEVLVCVSEPCPQPSTDRGLVAGTLVGGLALLLPAASAAALAQAAPRRSRALSAVALLVALVLSGLATVPQLQAIGATWRAGEPAEGGFPVLVGPGLTGAGAALALALALALLQSGSRAPGRLPRPAALMAAQVIVLLIAVSWFATAAAHALSALRFGRIDRDLARMSDPPTIVAQWVPEASAAGLFLVLTAFAAAALAALETARRIGRPGAIAIAALGLLTLAGLTVAAGFGVADLPGWTALDAAPAGPLSQGVLGLLLAAVLTGLALLAARR